MFLSTDDVATLGNLKAEIEGKSASEIGKLCDLAAQNVVDKQFPPIYAGILLADAGRITDAISLLEQAKGYAFSQSLNTYLKERGKFSPPGITFSDSRPYDVFTKTDRYCEHLEASLRIVSEFAEFYLPKQSNGSVTILDIGTGNGVLICEMINRLAALFNLKSCHLIVLDQSPSMHSASEIYCTKNARIPVNFTHIVGKIQDLGEDELARLLGEHKIWFINGALSLHHMPAEDKVRVLRNLRRFAPHFLITENHANHDKTAKNSPEFVYSVLDNYEFYIDSVLKSAVTDEDKKVCIDEFLLAEAINMLANDYDRRVDYHATIDQWSEYAGLAGYKVVKISHCVSLARRPATFIMQLRS